MSRPTFLLSLVLFFGLPGCRSEAPAPDGTAIDDVPKAGKAATTTEDVAIEGTSLLGEALLRPELDEAFRQEQEAFLEQARAELEAHPEDPEPLIWVGRRTAYLGRYGEAIEIFTRGILEHSEDARFYRHRGHRYITLRAFDRAIADFEKAAELLAGKEPEVEPDGLPNVRNQPTGTTHSSVWYHLGLAHYLKGDFERALEAYRECQRYSGNPDMLVATSHWLYMTLRRLGQEAEAAHVLELIAADMDIIENLEYHELLLMYRGEKSPEEFLTDREALSAATVGYGVANWFLYSGERDRAFELLRKVLGGESWAAFGYLAAEAEIARDPLSPGG